MLKYSGLTIDPFGYLWVCPRIKHMDIANVIQRVLENKQSLLKLHSEDGVAVYFSYIMSYIRTNTTTIRIKYVLIIY